MSGEIIIYQAADGQITIETRLEQDTVWLSQKQMTELFQTTKQNISLHIKNCFQEGELAKESTVKDFLTVQTEGQRKIERLVEYYNLDVTISVGYRVKSIQGTQFRIWANRILKEHLVQGYTINQKRLQEQTEKVSQLQVAIRLLERALKNKIESLTEAQELVTLLNTFSYGLEILDDYDHDRLEQTGQSCQTAVVINPDEFLKVVEEMRKDFDSELFGKPKDQSFDSSVRQIYQTFDNLELYSTIEHKAPMLLYMVVKKHSFVDGNKRIAAALFIYFLDKNGLLFLPDGRLRVSNDGLAALTLLIAVSKPEEKDVMVNMVITILNRGVKYA